MSDRNNWVLLQISDADEPEDLVRAGMRQRDFDGVMLLLVPDGEPGDFGWYGTERTRDGRPTRPLLLFFQGNAPLPDVAQAWAKECLQNGACGYLAPFPRSFSDCEVTESIHTMTIPLHYPPYPWLSEATLGMEMGKYFDQVECVCYSESEDAQVMLYQFRFFHGSHHPGEHSPTSPTVDPDDLPF